MAYRDFDKFLTEPEPIRFTYRGEDYKVRATIPMAAVLAFRGLDLDEDKEGGTDADKAGQGSKAIGMMDDLMARIVGRDNWTRLLAADVDMRAVMAIMSYIMDEAMSSSTDDEEEGEEGGSGNVTPTRPESPSTPLSNIGTNGKEAAGDFTISEAAN